MKYNKHLVTFVDILGFSEIVKKRSAEEVLRIVEIFSETNKPAIKSRLSPKVVQFSDSIVRAHRIDSISNIKHPTSIMYAELIALACCQIDLIQHKTLIRGGIALGDLVIKNGNAFGQAMLDSYAIESKFAIYPRIVLAPDLIDQMKINPLLWRSGHTARDEIKSYKHILSCDADGMWFIDYMRASSELLLDKPEYVSAFFKAHKALVIENGNLQTNLTSTASKYLWLASYHNKSVLACKDYLKEYRADDYLIHHKELLILKKL